MKEEPKEVYHSAPVPPDGAAAHPPLAANGHTDHPGAPVRERAIPGGEGGAEGVPREPRASGFGSTITRLAIQRPLFMLMAILGVLIFGAIGYTRMGVDLYPPVNIPVVLVSVPYPGASPEIVESLVTKPIEDAVAGLPNLDQVTSTSSEGSSTVVVTFTEVADADTVALEVEKRVNGIRGSLPTDILPPSVFKFDIDQLPIMRLTLAGDRSGEQLYRMADERVRSRLQSIDGVGQVSILGGQQREIQVEVDPARLRAYNLTLEQISQALGGENVNLPGGRVEEQSRNYNLRVDAKYRTVAELEDIIVSSPPTGGVVRVRDLATVVDGYKETTTLSRVNGQDAVAITITKQATANISNVAAATRAEVARIQQALPEDVRLEIIEDQSVFIRQSLDGVQRTLIEAIVLTGLVLLVFLHSWRSTVIVLLAIPTSLIATFGLMWLQGFSLNFISTLALALCIGILVDDSIVVLENIFRHLQRGEPARVAAINGRAEIGLAAIAITLVDVVVFTPVGLMSGIVGQYFRQFGLTVVVATLFSLAVSFTLTPLLASRWLRAEDEHGTGWLAAFGRWWERGFAAIERRYRGLLAWALRARWLVVAGGVVALVIGVALPAVGIVKSEFAPQQDQGLFTLTLEMAPGTNLTTTEAAVKRVEERILALPEVKTVATSVGGGDFTSSVSGSNSASISVTLKGKHERQRSSNQVADQARTFGQDIPGVKLRASVASLAGGSQPVQVSIYGGDLATVNRLAQEAQTAMTDLGTLVDVTNTAKPGSPEYHIRINRERASDLGLTASQVASAVRTAFTGSVATQLRRDNAVGSSSGIDVRVQLNDETRGDLTKLTEVPLLSPSKGGQVTLGQIATITPAQGPNQINHTDRQRVVTLGAGLAEGQNLSQVSAQVDRALRGMQWPSGYRFSMGGEVEETNEVFIQFAQAIMLSIVLVYMLLVALYESLLYPLVVLLALPLALVGAMLGLAISRETLNLFSLIGVIMLTGLVGKNSILVVDYTNQLRRQGLSRLDALLQAGPTRLRPILMTSAALIMAQIPLVLALEEGAELQRPLAVVVMGGMITSTLLALVFVPAVYTIIDDLQNLIMRLFRKGGPRNKKEGDMDDGVTRADESRGAPPASGRKVPVGATLVVTLLAGGSLLLSACGSAGPTASAATAPPPLSVAVAEVKAEDVRASYEASGSVEAVSQVQVAPKVAGQVARLQAEVGQRVAAGDVLAELDHTTLDAQVRQAEAQLATAQANLAKLERGPRREDVAGAAAQRDAAAEQARAAAAQATAAAQNVTAADGQIQAAQQQAAAAQAQVATARIRLEQLRNPRAEDLSLLQSQLAVARINLARAQTSDEAVKLAASQVETARAALEEAQRGARPEAIQAAQSALDQAQTALANITQQPVRAEDVEAARLAYEGAEAAWRTAQDVLADAQKGYNAARKESDNLTLLSRSQADAQLAQAEATLHQAQGGVEQARVQRDTARANYNKLSSGATEWDVRLAQERVDAAKAQLDLTRNPDPVRVKQAQLGLEQALLQLETRREEIAFSIQSAEEGVKQAEANLTKVTSPSGLDIQALEEGVNAAQAQANAAQAQVEILIAQRGGAEASAAAAGSQAGAAEAGVRQAEAALALRANPTTPEDVEAARAAVRQAQAGLDLARAQRADAFVTAPIEGTVAARNTTAGAMAGPSAPIVTLVSDTVEVAVPVEESRYPQIRPGQPVTLSATAFPGRTFGGYVVSISPSGDQRNRSFTARIHPDDPDRLLRPGMYVQVSIATDERSGVPVIPRDALIQRGGQSSVFVVGPDNKASLRPVRTGLLSGQRIEVVEGLQPGEQVVTIGLEDLRDGQTVAPTALPGTP
ncbi:MAG TPA: efflux RND transporter permease subunit [Chloroflexota bacterium]|nr:efflux RND transporter permease subunit [Chloroflexota bacterium]